MAGDGNEAGITVFLEEVLFIFSHIGKITQTLYRRRRPMLCSLHYQEAGTHDE